MTLRELKTWIDKLPDTFLDYGIVNGEEGIIDNEHKYRLDKPITTLMVDEENDEIVFLNQIHDDGSTPL